MNEQRLGGKLPSMRVVTTFAVLALIFLVLALVTFVHTSKQDAYNDRYLVKSAETQLLSEQMAKLITLSSKGDPEAFKQLKTLRSKLDKVVWELKHGSTSEDLPPSPDAVSNEIETLEQAWSGLREKADKILKAKEAVIAINEFSIVTSESVAELQVLNDELIELLVNSKASPKQVAVASELGTLLQRIANSARHVLVGGQETPVIIDHMVRDVDKFRLNLNGLQQGSGELKLEKLTDKIAVQRLTDIGTLFQVIDDNIQEIIANIPETLPALNTISDLNKSVESTNNAAEKLIEAYRQSPGRFEILGIKAGLGVIGVSALAAAVFLIFLGVQLVIDAQRREKLSKAQNEDNQRAILRLLDEMGSLADGDLTVSATVTEDITGAIADSINYAIDALRELVTTINETSVQVNAATLETQSTALQLADASDTQVDQIGKAGESIRSMTIAIDQMSKDATESAEVARRSVEIANKGGETVRNTIMGMDSIREQIQETSKRIKRLGESSQEIGDIVELIDDIADQTNILALNAAMQAAMAGEAGRGFAVVADEVQRLAERSINATKQIEALVKTIQSDTNEAVTSMEASTKGVVNGAQFAEEAGEALKEIESVSKYIAEQTSKIAETAQTQSIASKAVNESMIAIQDATNKTSSGTKQTAVSIGGLSNLAAELQKTVSGFHLPS